MLTKKKGVRHVKYSIMIFSSYLDYLTVLTTRCNRIGGDVATSLNQSNVNLSASLSPSYLFIPSRSLFFIVKGQSKVIA